MDKILRKYKKYDIYYNWNTRVFKVNKCIPVITFEKLRAELKRSGYKIKNIIVEGR